MHFSARAKHIIRVASVQETGKNRKFNRSDGRDFNYF